MSSSRLRILRDHPRTCGENPSALLLRVCPRGSPPHLRGKPGLIRVCTAPTGITPAPAGKTLNGFPMPDIHRDHPRTCGENSLRVIRCGISSGSPPHLRGKQYDKYFEAENRGITPAPAGKTMMRCASMDMIQDHPRTCGENKA